MTTTTRRPDDGDLEAALRTAFARTVEGLAATPDPLTRTTRAVRRDRTRRGAAAAVAAAVAAVAVLVTVVTGPWGGLQRSAPGPAGPAADIRSWPTRGDLAGDKGFLARLRDAAPDTEIVAVPFAGHLHGEEMAIALVQDPGLPADTTEEPAAVALYPGRSVPGDGINYLPLAPGRLTYATGHADGSVDVVVLLDPRSGTQVALSPRPNYDADGVPHRQFRHVDVKDGLALVRLDGTAPHLVSLRLTSGDRTSLLPADVLPSLPMYNGDVPGDGTIQALVGDGACGRVMTPDELTLALRPLYALRGLSGVTTATVLWCRKTDRGRAAALLLRPEDRSAAFVIAFEVTDLPDSSSTGPDRLAGQPVPPAQAETYPVPVMSGDQRPGRMLVCAPGAASVEVSSADGAERLAAARVTDGLATLTLPDGGTFPDEIELTAKDATGKVLARYVVDRTGNRDDLGIRVDGPVS